jgi:O-antigen ligase
MNHRYTAHCNAAAVWSAIALGFAIPISTAASNLLLGLVLLLSLVAGDWSDKLRVIRANPLALAACGFFILALIGTTYGTASAAEHRHYLGKYAAVLLIPVLVPLFAAPRDRLRALAAFLAAMGLTLLISLLLWLDWAPAALVRQFGENRDPFHTASTNAVVFKLSITQGFLMAIAAYLLMVAARHLAKTRWQRSLCLLLALLAASNVLFMIIGRTGYVVLAVLGAWLFACRYGRRGVLYALLAISLAGALAIESSPTFQGRMLKGVDEALQWQPDRGDKTSIGLRLDYYRNSLAIIAGQPLVGTGLGGFIDAYDARVAGTQMARSNNPHNQYLLITAQLGLIGLLALLAFHVTHWRAAGRLSPAGREIARGVLLAYLAGNLFNSFMLDFSERLFFAWLAGVLLAELAPAGALTKGNPCGMPQEPHG